MTRNGDFSKNSFQTSPSRCQRSTTPTNVNSQSKPPGRNDSNDTTNGYNSYSNGAKNESPSMKRSSSFVKELPKKKGFGDKEIQEVKQLLESLALPEDELIKKWIACKIFSTTLCDVCI